jgi:hypothetical protein
MTVNWDLLSCTLCWSLDNPRHAHMRPQHADQDTWAISLLLDLLNWDSSDLRRVLTFPSFLTFPATGSLLVGFDSHVTRQQQTQLLNKLQFYKLDHTSWRSVHWAMVYKEQVCTWRTFGEKGRGSSAGFRHHSPLLFCLLRWEMVILHWFPRVCMENYWPTCFYNKICCHTAYIQSGIER